MAGFWDFVPSLISAGATIYGAKQASDANDKGTQQLIQSQEAATAAQLQGIRVAQQQYEQQRTDASPGLLAVQEIVGRGDQLTPFQKQQIDDSRRKTLDTLQGGSLRGSARATAAAVQDVEGRQTQQFLDANRTRSDNAATALSTQYFNSGSNIANLNMGAGATVSNGLISAGNATASNTVNNAALRGRAIGDIGAVIADQFKSDDQKLRDKTYYVVPQGV